MHKLYCFTKVPLASQPEDMPEQIEELVKEYIQHENTIILAVHQATNDIATSKALRLVIEADPEGRTNRKLDSSTKHIKFCFDCLPIITISQYFRSDSIFDA